MRGFRSYASYKKAKKHKGPLSKALGFLLFCLLWVFLLNVFLIQSYIVRSDTMFPNYRRGDRVLGMVYGIKNPLTNRYIGVYHRPQRGEVAVVAPGYLKETNPLFLNTDFFLRLITFQRLSLFGNQPHVSPTALLRVVGVPGDELYMENGTVFIKEQGAADFVPESELSQRLYGIEEGRLPDGWKPDGPFGSGFPSIALGENEYFVLADARLSASDSRYWGVIPFESFQSRLFLRFWPVPFLQQESG